MMFRIYEIEDPEFCTNLVTKHLQVGHIKIIKRVAVVGVYYQFLNIISTFLKLVTIHERGNYLSVDELQKENIAIKEKLEKIRVIIYDEFDYTSFAMGIKIKKILEGKK